MATDLKPPPAWLDCDEREYARWRVDFATTFNRSRSIEPIAARIIDLSTHGCQLSTPGRTQVGSFVTLALPRSLTVERWIAWSNEEQAGMDFAHPIPKALVEHLAREAG